jgi:mono/diheme cytochrome c family protein
MTAPRALLAVAVVLLVAGNVSAAKGPSPEAARSLYETKCAPCHGKTGDPTPMFAKLGVRTFHDAEWQGTKTDEQLRASILAGKPGTAMRAFKDQLKPEEIDALIRHIRTLAAPAAK